MNYAAIFIVAALVLSSVSIIFFIINQNHDNLEEKIGQLEPPVLNKKISKNLFNYTFFIPPLR